MGISSEFYSQEDFWLTVDPTVFRQSAMIKATYDVRSPLLVALSLFILACVVITFAEYQSTKYIDIEHDILSRRGSKDRRVRFFVPAPEEGVEEYLDVELGRRSSRA